MEQVEYFSAKKLKMSKSGNRRRNPVTVTLGESKVRVEILAIKASAVY